MKRHEIKAQSRRQRCFEATDALTEKDGCTAGITSFEVHMGYCNLKDALKQSPVWVDLFMPELLKGIMGFVPGS